MSSKLSVLFQRARSAQRQTSPQPASSAIPQGLEVVSEGEEPIVDIVAIHGLKGHRTKTWTAANGVNWLCDLLPSDIPHARILCWGYDANTHASSYVSCQYLYDHAQVLVADLVRKRELTNTTKRPIIFVAHSLGGIIVKSALIHSDAARPGALHEHRSVKVSTYGIIFLGTPHQGAKGAQLGRVLANIASLFVAANDRLLKPLERDSEWLQQQLGQFGPISRDFVTKFAYEAYETPTVLGRKIMVRALQSPPTGKPLTWKQVVPKASAVVPGQSDAEAIVILADHRNLVKFSSAEESGYAIISEHLQIMVNRAGETIRPRWDVEARVHEATGKIPHQYSLTLNLSQVTEVPRFVARRRELEQMHAVLANTGQRYTIIVHGLGGVGKTQLAIAYIKRYHTDYSAAIWLNARDEVSLKQSFVRVAELILRQYPSVAYVKTALENRDPGGCAEAVKRWLDEPGNDRWLLVYDNYDEPELDGDSEADTALRDAAESGVVSMVGESGLPPTKAFDIRKFLPSSYHGAVMVTSRSSIIPIGKSVRVGKLDNISDSLEILASTSDRQDLDQDADAVELARWLDGFPLALSTAGTYVNQLSTTWAEYLKLYKESWLRLQHRSPRLSSYERVMYSTWDTSYKHIKQQNPASANLLRLWAYFDKDDLWYELLRAGSSPDSAPSLQTIAEDRLSFDHTMRLLCNYALVEANPPTRECGSESRGYSMHGCVHSWTIYVLNKEADEGMAQLATTCVASHIPDHDVPEYWYLQRRLLHHADRCLEIMRSNIALEDGGGQIAGKLGDLYIGQARLSDAEDLFMRALEAKEKACGPDHISALDTVHKLGIVFKRQGRLSDAERMYKRAFQGQEKELGPRHASTLDTLQNLGIVYKNQGRLNDAESTYLRALQGKESSLGPDHSSTLVTVDSLGILYKNQGRLDAAEKMHTRALKVKERTLGPDHTSTLDTIQNLGILYKNQGRLDDAESMYQQAIIGKEKAWGPDHPSTLDTVQNLGILYSKQGRLKDAEANYKRALAGFEQAWGPDHVSTLTVLDNLGVLYKKQDRLTDAEAVYEQALQGYEKTLGTDMVKTYIPVLNTLENLGDLNNEIGRPEDARTYYLRAEAGLRDVFGPSSDRCARIASKLAGLGLRPKFVTPVTQFEKPAGKTERT